MSEKKWRQFFLFAGHGMFPQGRIYIINRKPTNCVVHNYDLFQKKKPYKSAISRFGKNFCWYIPNRFLKLQLIKKKKLSSTTLHC